ncbi:hypothetical protein P9112_002594 [Eukaryota sp. TZLM1-RC]
MSLFSGLELSEPAETISDTNLTSDNDEGGFSFVNDDNDFTKEPTTHGFGFVVDEVAANESLELDFQQEDSIDYEHSEKSSGSPEPSFSFINDGEPSSFDFVDSDAHEESSFSIANTQLSTEPTLTSTELPRILPPAKSVDTSALYQALISNPPNVDSLCGLLDDYSGDLLELESDFMALDAEGGQVQEYIEGFHSQVSELGNQSEELTLKASQLSFDGEVELEERIHLLNQSKAELNQELGSIEERMDKAVVDERMYYELCQRKVKVSQSVVDWLEKQVELAKKGLKIAEMEKINALSNLDLAKQPFCSELHQINSSIDEVSNDIECVKSELSLLKAPKLELEENAKHCEEKKQLIESEIKKLNNFLAEKHAILNSNLSQTCIASVYALFCLISTAFQTNNPSILETIDFEFLETLRDLNDSYMVIPDSLLYNCKDLVSLVDRFKSLGSEHFALKNEIMMLENKKNGLIEVISSQSCKLTAVSSNIEALQTQKSSFVKERKFKEAKVVSQELQNLNQSRDQLISDLERLRNDLTEVDCSLKNLNLEINSNSAFSLVRNQLFSKCLETIFIVEEFDSFNHFIQITAVLKEFFSVVQESASLKSLLESLDELESQLQIFVENDDFDGADSVNQQIENTKFAILNGAWEDEVGDLPPELLNIYENLN